MEILKVELPEYPCTADMWDAVRAESRPIVVYGMGNGADKLIERLQKYDVKIADFFASDGFVRGHYFHGKRVKSFSEIREEYDDFLILLSFASARDEVLDMLSEIDEHYDMIVPDMPVAGIEEYFDKDFYNDNYGDIVLAYNSLCDSKSRNIFAAVLNYKLTGRMTYLMCAYRSTEEKYELISRKNISVAVDAGAYNGDTAREMKDNISTLKRVYAIEPDHKNFAKLDRYAKAESEIEVLAINAAAWSESGVSDFSTSGNRNSTISATPSHEHSRMPVNLTAIDEISESVDYIKYDVEGAEQEALLGSDYSIRHFRPVLLISLYHRSRDIFSITNYIHTQYPDYKLYLSRKRCTPAWEIELICVPE